MKKDDKKYIAIPLPVGVGKEIKEVILPYDHMQVKNAEELNKMVALKYRAVGQLWDEIPK